MAANVQPAEPPPPYEVANPSATASQSSSSHLQVPHKTRNGIPPHVRRSMEDEARDLPEGWVRQYDTKEHHQFFVDTTATPPRSVWHHPYDDEQYMSSLPTQERERIQALHHVPNAADIAAESSEDDTHIPSSQHAESYPRPIQDQETGNATGVHKLGRKLKNKMTSSTHDEREASRRHRADNERRAYEQHQHIRRQMSRALETGLPQLLGKDREGRDVYIEPPGGPRGAGFGGYGASGGYGYNPYSQGPYADLNAKFLRPQVGYNRPYGYGYGGGMGLPLLGGLGGGMLLGGLLF